MAEVWLREKSTLEQNEDGLLVMRLRTNTVAEGNLQPGAMAGEMREKQRRRQRHTERKAARRGEFRMETRQDAQIPGLTLVSSIKRQRDLCTSCKMLSGSIQESCAK